MHSWVFRNRRRLEGLYGLPAAREEARARLEAGTRNRPAPTPSANRSEGRDARGLRRAVLIPHPRRAA